MSYSSFDDLPHQIIQVHSSRGSGPAITDPVTFLRFLITTTSALDVSHATLDAPKPLFLYVTVCR